MNNYFFGESIQIKPESKAKLAVRLLGEYKQDRRRFIDILCRRYIYAMEQQINYDARFKGKNKTTFNFLNLKCEKDVNDEEFPTLTFEPLTNEEKLEILNKLCQHLEKEGFKYSTPEFNSYSSLHYQTNIDIKWDIPEETNIELEKSEEQ